MKEFFSHIRGAVVSTVVLSIVCCGLYPLIVFGISQALFRDKANGSLIVDPNGMVHGSKLLAQSFTADKYFHPRPSAAGNGYDAANSSGSNLGPTSQKLNDAIKDRVAAYRKENGLSENDCRARRCSDGIRQRPRSSHQPAQRGTANFRVSPKLADCLRRRFANSFKQNTDGRDLGFLGEPGVNVLKLNLALDARPTQP